MATIKQKKAVKELVGNGGNVTKAMKDVGYSKETAHTPQKLTNSKGFKEICKENGLTEQFITKCLYNDIKDKPKNRKGELELASKILGLSNEKLQISGGAEAIVIRQVMYNTDYNITKKDGKLETAPNETITDA